MRLYWTNGANKSLEEIEAFIANDNPIAAIDTVIQIIDSANLLVKHPEMGKPGRIPETRELVVAGTPFILPYRCVNNQIEILRVINTAMLWPENF